MIHYLNICMATLYENVAAKKNKLSKMLNYFFFTMLWVFIIDLVAVVITFIIWFKILIRLPVGFL